MAVRFLKISSVTFNGNKEVNYFFNSTKLDTMHKYVESIAFFAFRSKSIDTFQHRNLSRSQLNFTK